MLSVRNAILVSIALVLFACISSSVAQAQEVALPAPRGSTVETTNVQASSAEHMLELREPREGSLAAELAMATLGDLVGMTLTTVVLVPAAVHDLSSDERSEGATPIAVGLSLVPRPFLVGGFAALGGRMSHGEGRSGMAMLGAMPGTLLIGAGWALGAQDVPKIVTIPLFMLGHVGTIVGSVVAYRYSARSLFSERAERALRYAPTPVIDRERGMAGLSLSGTF